MDNDAQLAAAQALTVATFTTGSVIDPELVAYVLTPFLDKSIPNEPMDCTTQDEVLAVALAIIIRETRLQLADSNTVLPLTVTSGAVVTPPLVLLLGVTDSNVTTLQAAVSAATNGEVQLTADVLSAVAAAIGGATDPTPLVTVVVTTWTGRMIAIPRPSIWFL